MAVDVALSGVRQIAPHGGKLVDLHSDDAASRSRAQTLPRWELDERGLADLECLATGVYSPLTGFLGEADHAAVVERTTLADGTVWSIPITLGVDEAFAAGLARGNEIALASNGQVLATLKIDDLYRPDKQHEAEQVYLTADEAHPGVAALYASGPVNLGGTVTLLEPVAHDDFAAERLTPAETRAAFAARGWRTVVAFQTRNPIHRAHEYLQKVALEIVDGLFVNPLVGATKSDDVSPEVRMETYHAILGRYYPADRVLLGVFPAAMRYAGPREAILHAIARQNYGCSHFIVGRDHAGVGNYYGTYDAQEIFDTIEPGGLRIEPLKFEHAFYCKRTQSMATTKTSPSEPSERVFLSGTKVREMLEQGELPPPEFTRPEVAEILIRAYREGR